MDDDEARAILREHGKEPSRRGKLAKHWHEEAEQLRQGPPNGAGDDYDLGAGPEDFTEASLPPDEPDSPIEERKPGPVAGTRPGLRQRLSQGRTRAKAGSRAKSGKGKTRHVRIPVDRLCEHAWDGLARLTAGIDVPVSRCLSFQAPVAGLVLEDTIKGTFVDKALQPVARAEEKGRKVIALVGPPLIVAALEAAQGLPEDQRKIREAFLVPMLRESMVLWVQIAGDKVEEKAARDAELGPVQEQVDNLLAMIFAPPPAGPVMPADHEAARAQEAAGV